MASLNMIHEAVHVPAAPTFSSNGLDDGPEVLGGMYGIVELMKHRQEFLFISDEERILDTIPPS